jgi:hypothetical protein
MDDAELTEPDAFCFKCGTDIWFATEDSCNCDYVNLNFWLIRPDATDVMDMTQWYPSNVCLLSSYDGSFGFKYDHVFTLGSVR